jgi:ABC-type nitrate/sulfonate/bicarbonate transport system substrate-binding protein
MWRGRRIGWVLALLAVCGPAFAQAPVQGSGGLKLDIPYNAVAINMAPMWTAIEKKLFQRYGIEATTELSSQSPVLVASMLSGETPFAIVGEDAVISADLNGGDIVILVTGTEKLFFTLVAQPSIHSISDLKGKKVGVTRFGTTTDFIARYLTKQAGLVPDRDVTFIPAGSDANVFAALSAGELDAGVQGSDVILKSDEFKSFNALANMYDRDLLFYTGSLVGKKSWIAAHPDDTLNVVRGFLAGIASVFNDKKAAMAAIGKYTATTDHAALERAHALMVRMLLKVPAPRPAGIVAGLDESPLPAAKTADPARFIDPSFVDRLDQDGFIAGLYQDK